MSADELKARLAESQQRQAQKAQLGELLELGKWKDAAQLRDELEGREPARGQVVHLNEERARR